MNLDFWVATPIGMLAAFVVFLLYTELTIQRQGNNKREELLEKYCDEVTELRWKLSNAESDNKVLKNRLEVQREGFESRRKDVTDRVRLLLEHLEGNEKNHEEAE